MVDVIIGLVYTVISFGIIIGIIIALGKTLEKMIDK